MDHDQFITVVEQVAVVDREAAERATRATLQTLAERLSREQARGLVERLPPELGPWLFTDGAAERVDVDVEGARRATDAVLETLAERIAGGEVDDLIGRLPLPLHAP